MLPKAIVWADGSCQAKYGGWAAIINLFVGEEISRQSLSGCEYPTTNNRMEMRAVIEAVKSLSRPHNIYLVSDSAYLINTMKNRWYQAWAANGERSQRPNWDLWQQLIQLDTYHKIEYVKVKGHTDEPTHNQVDRMALAARLDGKEKWIELTGNSD